MAASLCGPFQTEPEVQVTVYGSLWAVAITVPSTVKSTEATPTSSLALAVSETVPLTASPGSGTVSVATGGVTSGPPPTAMQWPSEQRSSSGQSPLLSQVQPAAKTPPSRVRTRVRARMPTLDRLFGAPRQETPVRAAETHLISASWAVTRRSQFLRGAALVRAACCRS